MLYHTLEEAKKALATERWQSTHQAQWFLGNCDPAFTQDAELLALIQTKKEGVKAFKSQAPKVQEGLKSLLAKAANTAPEEFVGFGTGYKYGDVVNVPVVWVYETLCQRWGAKPVNRKCKHFFDKECQKSLHLTEACDGKTIKMVCTGGKSATRWVIV